MLVFRNELQTREKYADFDVEFTLMQSHGRSWQ